MKKEKHRAVNRNGDMILEGSEHFEVTSAITLLKLKTKFLLSAIITLLLSRLIGTVAAEMGSVPDIGKIIKSPTST